MNKGCEPNPTVYNDFSLPKTVSRKQRLRRKAFINFKKSSESSGGTMVLVVLLAPVAQLVEHRAVMRVVVRFDSCLTNTQGLKMTEEKVLPL